MKIYNTFSRKIETFKPIHEKSKEVGVYSCGPTVYWYQHIGNLRTYIFSDVLKRVLIYDGYKVKHVINVTDVGHLTSDADEGEDKMERAAKKEGKTAGEIADFYLRVFKEDFEKLNILNPNFWPKASEHIKEQIEVIKVLEKKGFTYKTNDGIYFDTSKDKKYGKLAKLNKELIIAGKRVGVGEKKNKTDFALWKFSGDTENGGKRLQEWDSPWGVGFPGWHVECSAMSIKYLGDNFDIHTGGIDHVQIHHTNEIAQSENSTGKKFVNYWMHAGWLLSEGKKISKSSGGLFTVSQLEEKGYNPLAFRYLCLTTHYKKPLDFSLKNLDSSQTAYKRLKNIISELKDDRVENKTYLKDFEKAINDDLNMPEALQVLWKLVRDEKVKGKVKTIKKMDEVFGLKLLEKDGVKIPSEIKKLVDEREKSRKEKNWKLSDELRDKIKKLGFSVDDTDKGSVVKKL
ncbi:cysteine--tRNA ligase [Candidatus Pacearchaeota archaeon CG10_big_fil_rev_8_21_14_0_10_32_14]|nr:MAG: cysteine--tRNA ligase [Candidatus Pacearchaeota archaeon CG10_big_fil_rev_8_21_14_0_10_32_14]